MIISLSIRGRRGGAWDDFSNVLLASARGGNDPTLESFHDGFRVATVPEPSAAALAIVGLCGVAPFGKRRGCRYRSGALALVALLITFAANAHAVTIDTVPVGNAGNAADTVVRSDGTTGYGSVDYDYRIGTIEVTNAQYADFLNAKAASDPLGLYDANMSMSFGGITRSGSSGSFTYGGAVFDLTQAGAFAGTTSPYGAFDMGGQRLRI